MYTKHVTDMLLDKPSYELSSKQKKNEIKKKKLEKGVETETKYVNEKRHSNR